MSKIKIKIILGFIGSLTVASHSLAKQINIYFENQGSFYTSPVVYLTGENGQYPVVAVKEGILTTGGVDAKDEHLTEFNFVSFEATTKLGSKIQDIDRLSIIPFKDEEDPFCKNLNLTIAGNKILFPATFPKLTTSTSCHFAIVTLDYANNEVTENKITFNFNYTLKGWLGDLGKGTNAQYTAEILKDTDPNAKNINISEQNIFDISPLLGFIHVQTLDLSKNQIRVIPDAIGNLTNLNYLDFKMNKIEVIPETIGKLTNLQELVLNLNQIRVIPDVIGNLVNLKFLELSRNQIEVIPDSIENLNHLNYLMLHFNQIKVIPDTIGNLSNLIELFLYNNQIIVIPDAIGNLIHLKELILHYNQIRVIPDAIRNLTHLHHLFLNNNQIHFINKSLYNWLLEENVNLSYNPGTNNKFGNKFI